MINGLRSPQGSIELHTTFYFPLRRGCRMFSAALYAHVRTSLTIAHETAGAARIRHSLRPLTTEGERIPANLGRRASRECETVSTVIASAAKQSMPQHEERMDCFAALAMTR